MNCKLSTLSSGLRVLTAPMPSLESATVTIWVKTGSRFEEKRINGISHFLEHMVFKGSKKRPSAKAISEVVDSFGGEFNAATSKDWTNFYIKSRVGNLEIAMDVLSDMVLNPLLKPEEIEREKGTIIQEIAMYEDTPTMHIGDVFEELTFGGHPLGWEVAGTPESVKAIRKEDFINYRKAQYHPENMIVSVSGGVNSSKILGMVEKYFDNFDINNSKPLSSPKFRVVQREPQISVKEKKSDQAHLILGFLGDARDYKGRFAQSVLSTILSGPMSSRLFIQIRERRGLAYSVRPTLERFAETGYFGVYAGVDIKKIDEAIKVILDQLYGLAEGKYPITLKELNKTKEFLKGHMALGLEDTQAVGDFFATQALFLKEILSPEEVYKKIDAVTIDEVIYEAKRLFNPNRLNLAIIGPFKNKEKFVQLLK
jgi:predicted Zn-dependent peptidase